VSALRSLVLCYHGASAEWVTGLSVDPEAIGNQVGSLVARGFRGATAADVFARSGRNLHVTFDDAYRSVERVLPELERLRVPVTVFACSALADGGRAVDIPELAGEREAFPEEVLTIDWDGLRTLAERGVEIGSHTHSHAHLTQLDDRALLRELVESRETIAEQLGRACRYLAYPYGEQDRRVREAARRAGYESAFALPGHAMPLDPFALPRVGLYRRDTPARVRVKTSTAGRVLAGVRA
jgi:peptidoglycan/xylan/chitin deacetylase (PgdA/CDA1 family)